MFLKLLPESGKLHTVVRRMTKFYYATLEKEGNNFATMYESMHVSFIILT